MSRDPCVAQVRELHLEMAAQTRVGAGGGAQAKVAEARLLERGGDWQRAMEAYLGVQPGKGLT